ncbi:MAG: hypothetical protein ACFFCS_23890 [Candidatus Hodarchaeota archaeon]
MEKQRVRKEEEKPLEDDKLLEEKEIKDDDWILEDEPTFQTVISYQRELENFKQSLIEIQKLIEIPDNIKRILELDKDSELLSTLETDIEIEGEEKVTQQEALTKEAIIFGELCKLHDWLDDMRFEFMYSAPKTSKKDEDYKEWIEEWSKVLFDFSRLMKNHIMYLQELLKLKPFSELRSRQQFIIEFGDHLVKNELAKWLTKKEKLRIYWKSLEEWADNIYDWAYNNAMTEPLFVYDLKESGQDFSDLPENEFSIIFKILESQKKARLVKSSDKRMAIIIEFNV